MIAAHAEWGVETRKRWVRIGKTDGDGWVVDAPHPTRNSE
jgi:hypothetical protein